MPELPEEPLTVVELKVDAFKRIRAAHVHPTPTGLVYVRGRNGQGKSSLIGSMLDVLGVERDALPITEGEHAGEILVDLGSLIVREKLTRDASGKAKRSLTIQGKDGAKFPAPASVLKELRSKSADPVAFERMPAADQVKTVLRILGMDVDLERLEGEAETIYDRRRDLGRDADKLGKAAAEIEAEVAGLSAFQPTKTVPELTDELKAAKDHNAGLDAQRQKQAHAEERGKALATRIEQLEAELEKARVEKDEREAEWQHAAHVLKHTDAIDLAPITAALHAHEEAAKSAGRRELAEETRRQADDAKAQHAAAEEELSEKRGEIDRLLAEADFPVDGMSYDQDAKTLTLAGVPFAQASQAERLRAAACIAMAGDPQIRVLFAREGSLLDDSNRQLLDDVAKERGFQVWLEVVDDDPNGAGLWIEDGEAHEQPDPLGGKG